MTSKTKVAVLLVLLFAGLFLFTLAEAPAQLLRLGRPIAAVVIFGYLVYVAVVLLRNSNKVADAPSAEDQHGAD